MTHAILKGDAVRNKIASMKRIIVKIGTSLLTTKDGQLNKSYIARIAEQVRALVQNGKEVILVTSGAIGAGRGELGLQGKIRDIALRQVTAAVGQAILMGEYKRAFKEQKIAQILLTYDTFTNRKTYLNMKRSLEKLLSMGIVPIINENDPIAIDEIDKSFGDNDRLSALVATKVDAELLIILTDTEGLYDKNPRKSKKARLISVVEEVNKDILSLGGKPTEVGIGGMKAKLQAAKIATEAGVLVVIANGNKAGVLQRILKGDEIGTMFLPKKKMSNKRRWIKFTPAKGVIHVDKGAKAAMLNGKNLLPAGIVDVEGNFDVSSVVDIACEGTVFAKALVDYSSRDLRHIMGKNSEYIKEVLGYRSYDNVVRRENLVFLESEL